MTPESKSKAEPVKEVVRWVTYNSNACEDCNRWRNNKRFPKYDKRYDCCVWHGEAVDNILALIKSRELEAKREVLVWVLNCGPELNLRDAVERALAELDPREDK